jgi:hypothetical protein
MQLLYAPHTRSGRLLTLYHLSTRLEGTRVRYGLEERVPRVVVETLWHDHVGIPVRSHVLQKLILGTGRYRHQLQLDFQRLSSPIRSKSRHQALADASSDHGFGLTGGGGRSG